MRRYNQGWRRESARHGLSAQGVKTGRKSRYCDILHATGSIGITQYDVKQANESASNAAIAAFTAMVHGGSKYVVTTSGGGLPSKEYELLGLMGFAGIHTDKRDVKDVNMLKKLGVEVSKDYPSGYYVRVPYDIPESVLSMHREGHAYAAQSVDIKKAANTAWLAEMQQRGFLKNATVVSRLD